MQDPKPSRVRSLDGPTLDVPIVTFGPDGPGQYMVAASIWLTWDTSGAIPDEYRDEFWGETQDDPDRLMGSPFTAEFEEELEDALEAVFRSFRRRILHAVEDTFENARWELYKRHPELAPEATRKLLAECYPELAPQALAIAR